MSVCDNGILYFIKELCMKNLNLLNTYGMITMDDETIDVKPTGMLNVLYLYIYKLQLLYEKTLFFYVASGQCLLNDELLSLNHRTWEADGKILHCL